MRGDDNAVDILILRRLDELRAGESSADSNLFADSADQRALAERLELFLGSFAGARVEEE